MRSPVAGAGRPAAAATTSAPDRRAGAPIVSGWPRPVRSHRPEPVGGAADGLYVDRRGGGVLALQPQPLHAGVDQPGVAEVVVLPDRLQQLFAGEYLAG